MDTDRILEDYENPVVRDLVWSVISPPLLKPDGSSPVLPDTEWFISLYEQNRDLFLDLEKEPQSLLERVHNRTRIPLGIYFQRLLGYFLTRQHTYQLVLSGKPVSEGTKTIGEFDFIVWNPVEKIHEHWEIASKFYLSVGGTHELTHCYGPNPEDRLDRKFRHLVQHQCKLSETAAGKSFLDSLGIKISRTRILLKGRLFYHGNKSPYPKLAHPEHPRGWWMTEKQVMQFCKEKDYKWIILKKHQWLAPLKGQDDLLDWHEIPERFAQEGNTDRPLAVALLEENNEINRGFIVPQDWLEQLAVLS